APRRAAAVAAARPAGPPPRTTTSNSPKTGVRRAGSSIAEAAGCAIAGSVEGDLVLLDDRPPALDVRVEPAARLGRRVGDHLHIERLELFLDVGLLEDLHDRVVDLRDDRLRRSGGNGEAHPRVGLHVLQAG